MPDLFEGIVDNVDPEKDYLPDLVGDGKKYKTVQDLARSVVHKDIHINRLEGEGQQLRDELSTRINREDFLDQLKSITQVSNRDPQDPNERQEEKSAMSPQQIAELVAAQINQTEQQKAAQQNLNSVQNKLREAYGPNYANKLRQQAQELDMSEQEINSLAARNPKMLFKLLGLGSDRQTESFTTPPRTQASGFTPTGGKKGKSYYDELYKTDPNKYFSPEVYNERYKLIQEIGIEAYNNN